MSDKDLNVWSPSITDLLPISLLFLLFYIHTSTLLFSAVKNILTTLFKNELYVPTQALPILPFALSSS